MAMVMEEDGIVVAILVTLDTQVIDAIVGIHKEGDITNGLRL